MKKLLTVLLGLICTLQTKSQECADVRLVGGPARSIGRVEMYYRGSWGTICNDYFERNAAQVACRSAGFRNARPTVFNARVYPLVNSTILLDEIDCAGDESDFLWCNHAPVGTNDCTHYEDVAVDCYGEDLGKTGSLQNGTSTAGVLVLTHAGISSTVCSVRLWNTEDAIVACRMMGFNMVDTIPITLDHNFFRGTNDLPILLPSVYCRGNESNLAECTPSTGPFSPRACTHADDVALDCLGTRNMDVFLENGNATHGEVHFRSPYARGPMCRNRFPDLSRKNIQVLCRSIGYSRSYGVMVGFAQTNGTAGFTYKTTCRGDETSIFDCLRADPLKQDWCSAVPVIACLPQPDIAVRLIAGNSSYGTLEIQVNGTWGTVCGDDFFDDEAKVVCRMLGQPSVNAARISNYYTDPDTNTTIVLENTDCKGTEEHILDCYPGEWEVHKCIRRKDILIHCQ